MHGMYNDSCVMLPRKKSPIMPCVDYRSIIHLSKVCFSCLSGGGGGRIRARHRKIPLRMLRTTSAMNTTTQCKPYTMNWRVTSIPAMNDMTSTAEGHAVHATDNMKVISAQADVNIQSAGIRAETQKNRYLP